MKKVSGFGVRSLQWLSKFGLSWAKRLGKLGLGTPGNLTVLDWGD